MALLDSIENYYEKMVVETIQNTVNDMPEGRDRDFLEDIACIALNQLPARYIREAVDASFYLTTEERNKMEMDVYEAVNAAINQVKENPEGPRRSETYQAD